MVTTVSYNLQPIPIWYFADLTGKPLASGYMLTWSSLDPTLAKFAYRDPNGTVAWPQRIDFNLNGSQGPFYWKFDSANPNDLYFLQVYDVNNNLQFTINNYGGDVGGGGGGGGTTYVNLRNYVINGVYQSNIGTSVVPLPQTLTLAPGAHDGFVTGSSAAGTTGPDITFSKSNTTSIDDQITFSLFPQGVNTLAQDVTPIYYLNYQTGSSATGETYKFVQYPLVSKVQNLSNTQVSFTIWARCNSGSNVAVLYLRQFYGDGPSASTEVKTPIATLTLSSSWKQYSVTAITPNSNGKIIGECHNDGLYLQFEYPHSSATNIDHTKPTMYLGAVFPSQSFDTPDDIDSLIDTPRTGDVRTSLNNFSPLGWVPMNDGSIGSLTSSATTRANSDTFPLYSTIWNGVADAFAPVVGGRGASAVADYSANKAISLTKALGRVMAGTITPLVSSTYTTNFAVNNQLTMASTTAFVTGAPIVLSVSGGGATPPPLTNTETYYVINLTATTIALATTPENAIAGTQIVLTGNGSGTQTITVSANPLGQFLGEVKHTMTTAELVSHTHNISGGNFVVSSGTSFNNGAGSLGQQANTNATGSSTPFNIMQPTTYMNFFIKL